MFDFLCVHFKKIIFIKRKIFFSQLLPLLFIRILRFSSEYSVRKKLLRFSFSNYFWLKIAISKQINLKNLSESNLITNLISPLIELAKLNKNSSKIKIQIYRILLTIFWIFHLCKEVSVSSYQSAISHRNFFKSLTTTTRSWCMFNEKTIKVSFYTSGIDHRNVVLLASKPRRYKS